MELIRQETPEETFRKMVEIGVLTEDGELTPHYQQPPPKPRRKKKA